MKYLSRPFLGILAISLFLLSGSVWGQQSGRVPATAFDSSNNRYLMVWEEDSGGGKIQIMGKFLNSDGTDFDTNVHQLSPDRPTQGCFYGNFDSDNGAITTPTNCPDNLNPAIAYNNGQYLITWEVHGSASSPGSAPSNQFKNIFARIVDAGTLNALPGWDEGILISKVFIAANNANEGGNGKDACNDGEIQAWSQSINPDVAPRINGGGFVVTWQTNKDFIGCANAQRRRGWSIYGRYIDQSFSATSNTNPPMFAVFKDDSTMDESCAALSNVDNGSNPRIAYNQTKNDFAVVYEVARADGGTASVGAKKVTLNSSNVGQVMGTMMVGTVASVDGSNLLNPEVVSFQNQYVLLVSDENEIRGKTFDSDSISSSSPGPLSLGSGAKTRPRASSNLGEGGNQTPSNAPERILVAYEQGGNVFVAVLDSTLNVTSGPTNISDSLATENQLAEVGSDGKDFVAVWAGQSNGSKVFAEFIESESTDQPPSAPGLLTPSDGVTFAPTRAYLSWNPSNDPEGGAVTYNVFFGENTLPGTAQATGITSTDFVIGPETQATTGITLQPNRTYKWAIQAQDQDGNKTLSGAERTLNTDNSVVGWWRFDENPAGPVCAGGSAGETECDYSGNNNHGVPNGSPIWIMPGMPGILGGALNLDGVNDFISVEDASSLNISGSITVEIYAEGGASGGAFLARDESANASAGNYQLSNNSITGDISVRFHHGVGIEPNRHYLAASTPFITGNGALINFRHTFGNGATTEIRVDNLVQAGAWVTGTGNELPIPVNNLLGIGAVNSDLGGNVFYDGIIDEIIVYDKYLSNQELDNGFDSRP